MTFRPQFSLRTLFLLVTISAVLFNWLADNLSWMHRRHEFLEAADFYYHNPSLEGKQPIRGPWPLNVFGEVSCKWLAVPHAKVQRAKELFSEVHIHDRSSHTDP